jgi:hypothetical protein
VWFFFFCLFICPVPILFLLGDKVLIAGPFAWSTLARTTVLTAEVMTHCYLLLCFAKVLIHCWSDSHVCELNWVNGLRRLTMSPRWQARACTYEKLAASLVLTAIQKIKKICSGVIQLCDVSCPCCLIANAFVTNQNCEEREVGLGIHTTHVHALVLSLPVSDGHFQYLWV